MNDLAVVDKGEDWRRLKAWCSIPSPPDHETGLQPGSGRVLRMVRPGAAAVFPGRRPWRLVWLPSGPQTGCRLHQRAVRNLVVEAADNDLLAPELAQRASRGRPTFLRAGKKHAPARRYRLSLYS